MLLNAKPTCVEIVWYIVVLLTSPGNVLDYQSWTLLLILTFISSLTLKSFVITLQVRGYGIGMKVDFSGRGFNN